MALRTQIRCMDATEMKLTMGPVHTRVGEKATDDWHG
jgi:hypothetical protein